MSSDQSVSEVAAAPANSSSKRLHNEGERKELNPQNQTSQNSTIDTERDGENPTKRVKVEATSGGVTVNNLLKPVDNDTSATGSSSSSSSSSRPTNHNDDKTKGDHGVNIVSSNTTTTIGTGTVNTGIDVVPVPATTSQRETSCGATTTVATVIDDSTTSHALSPVVTRSRSTPTDKKSDKETSHNLQEEEGADCKERWRVHQMAEDYTNFVGAMMYPATQFQPYGYNPEQRQYPMEKISMLGFIKNPLRRPTIIEKWSPYEIAIFEGSMLHYGKEFRNISRQIGTKTTREVIDFYYIWKKTAHYKKWKDHFISDEDLLDEFLVPAKKPKR